MQNPMAAIGMPRGDCRGGGGQRDFKEELNRLASFGTTETDFPSQGAWIIRMAAVGFYRLDEGSPLVRCAFCNVTLSLACFTDTDPMDLHKRKSLDCPLMEEAGPEMRAGQEAGRRAGNVTFHQQGQKAARSLIAVLFGSTGNNDTHSQQSSRQQHQMHQPGETLPAHQQRQVLTDPSSLPQLPGPSTSQQSQSVKTSDPRQQRQSPAMSVPQQSQSLSNSPSQLPSISHVSAGQQPANRSDLARRTSSLPTRSAASPLAAHVHTDSPHSLESRSPRPSGISPGPASANLQAPEPGWSNQHQEPRRPESREPSRPLPSSQPTGLQAPEPGLPMRVAGPATSQNTELLSQNSSSQGMEMQTTYISLPFQTAQPVSQLQQGISSSDASGQSDTTQTSSGPAPSGGGESGRHLVSYRQLGIYTEPPLRRDLSICSVRVDTFANPEHPWPHPDTLTPEDMAHAGFYYVGLEDLVRCFYCKGGLKVWAHDLKPWVEHARHFPQCPFVGQAKGQEFIDVVQDLAKTRRVSVLAMAVEEEVQRRKREERAKFDKAKFNKDSDAETEGAVGGAEWAASSTGGGDEDANETTRRSEELQNENKNMVGERLCKICGEDDVSILFLPCGHLVSCAQCSPALRTCAMCRSVIKGRVRVIGSE